MNNSQRVACDYAVRSTAARAVELTKRRANTRLFVIWLVFIVIATGAAVFDCPFPGLLALWGVCGGLMLAGLLLWFTPVRYDKNEDQKG